MGFGVIVESEVKQGIVFIDSVFEVGVEYFVYFSVERGGDEKLWDNFIFIFYFQFKQKIEMYLCDVQEGKLGVVMGWIILWLVVFMDNFVFGFFIKVFMVVLRNWLGDNGKLLQWIVMVDIGVFVVMVFEDFEKWNRKVVGLVGDELIVEQLGRVFIKVIGQFVLIMYWFLGSVLMYVVKEMGIMIVWFVSDGYVVDIEVRRRDYLGLMMMEQWLQKKSGWVQLK